MRKIGSFTDLDAWKQAHILTIEIYKVTKLFPKEETYGISSQMRRASSSVAFNISEGYSRRSDKEKICFYTISKSSLNELQSQLILAKDLEYFSLDDFKQLASRSIRTAKVLSGLIRSVK